MSEYETPPRILVVDDDVGLAHFVVEVLTDAGHSAVATHSAAGASSTGTFTGGGCAGVAMRIMPRGEMSFGSKVGREFTSGASWTCAGSTGAVLASGPRVAGDGPPGDGSVAFGAPVEARAGALIEVSDPRGTRAVMRGPGGRLVRLRAGEVEAILVGVPEATALLEMLALGGRARE